MKGERKSAATKRRRRSCPMCGKPAAAAHAPFCSRACADQDLGLWFRGAYRIPAVEPLDESAAGVAEDESADGTSTGGAARDDGRE